MEMVSASNVEKIKKLMDWNVALLKSISDLEKANLSEFTLTHTRLSARSLSSGTAKVVVEKIIAGNRRQYLANRTELRMLGVNPDE